MPEYTQTSAHEGRPQPSAGTSLLLSLLPIIGVVFVAYLVIGLALPVLPLHVQVGLGRSTFIVGLVAGSQFAVAVFTRPWTGYFADSRGSKRAVVVGLVIAVISGLGNLLSLLFLTRPVISVTILLLGRMLLGVAENFLITGALSWGLAMGAFTSFLDLSLGLTGPALGLVASGVGLDSVFLVSTLIVLCSLAIAARLLFAPAPDKKDV